MIELYEDVWIVAVVHVLKDEDSLDGEVLKVRCVQSIDTKFFKVLMVIIQSTRRVRMFYVFFYGFCSLNSNLVSFSDLGFEKATTTMIEMRGDRL
uniref:Uncharacterized protein n=1 Tax=Nelumbo nucifera TaxID=4432 RepID=A0A822ZF10_NELNU|nr:TPA_asm: hypothetical protein HUJ06_001383 [Nelumbo nucifera]